MLYKFLFLLTLSLVTTSSYAQQYVVVVDPNSVVLSIENERKDGFGLNVVDLKASAPGHRSTVLCAHYTNVMKAKKDFLETILDQAKIDQLMVVISKDTNSCADWSDETIKISDIPIRHVTQ